MQLLNIFFCLLCLAVPTFAGPEIDIDEAELPFEFPYPYPYPPKQDLYLSPGAYCSRCLAVVSEYCQIFLRSSAFPQCAAFNRVSAESLCARIGAYSLCPSIAEDLDDAQALVSSNQADSYGICQALQLCP